MGQKVSKTVTDVALATTSTTDYLAGFQYFNNELKMFSHAEGYVNCIMLTPTSYDFRYVFNYVDHLGNIRLSYGLDPATQLVKVLEENHYYPFGMKQSGYNMSLRMYNKQQSNVAITQVCATCPAVFKANYKYNGKELQDELGLNTYDYGARGYMPDIARWGQMDPLAEIYRRHSPYNYAVNNPVYFIDPDGMHVAKNENEDEVNSSDTDELIINGTNPQNISSFQSEVNKGLGANHTLEIDANGKASLKNTGANEVVTQQQQAFYDTLSTVINDKATTNIDIVANDSTVEIGSFQSGEIDIADAVKLGSSDLSSPQFISTQGAIGHEVSEQFEKQTKAKASGPAHAAGLVTENAINGSVRTDVGVFQINDKSGNPMPNGSAIQSSTTIGTTNRTINIIMLNGNVNHVIK